VTARIMHIDLDAFFVEVCRQQHPELREIECLVVGGRRNERGVVQSASYAARRFGVRAGMPIAEAARRCPEATFFRGSFTHYRDASRAVRKVLERHSPRVVMASLDEGYLDYSGTERLFPVSLLPEAERVRNAVRDSTGLDCSIGIGTNRTVAKLASDHAKPRGLMEVRAGWEGGFLAGLSLKALPGVGPKTAERWAKLGITEVVQIQQMELEALKRLIGDYAPELKLRAQGHGSSYLSTDGLPKSVSRETTLARDATERGELDALIALFVARVAAQLRDEDLTARTVVLKLRHGDFYTITRRKTLDQPTALDKDLLHAARGLFERAYPDVKRRGKGVRLIGVAATGLVRTASGDLFESEERRKLRDLTAAVDKVRRRFGFDAVASAEVMPVSRKERDR
jgi:DNA polymerase-4